MSKKHLYLKIAPKYYMAIEKGEKTFEVRYNDRDYRVGDMLHLREWTELEGYSGRELLAEVTYILSSKDFCKEGFVIMSINTNISYGI